MMPKEEMLELAKKCGAFIDKYDHSIEFSPETFAAYTSAIEKKHQAQNVELQKQIAMLREGFKRIVSESINAEYIAEEMLTATQATADAWEAEVKARALEYAADECRKEASEIFGAKADGAWLCEERLRRRAAELRNQQPAQPRKPCTCDGWCDGLCLEKEGKRK